MSGRRQVSVQAKRYLERLCWAAAVACLLPFAIATGAREYYESRSVAAALATAQSAPSPTPVAAGNPGAASPRPHSERPLWAPQRLKSFLRYKSGVVPSADAVLSLPNQAVSIPVFAGTSEVSMTLGAGHLTDTSPLEGSGNIAVSAHRDGSFRILKDVELGDPLVLSVGGEDRVFIVKRQAVVDPEQVEVLEPTSVTTLTLVTCYPFYFIGKAPKRYIVQAEIVDSPEALEALNRSTAYAADGPWRSNYRMRRNDI